MIKLRDLIRELLAEAMTYADLMQSSDPDRIDRGSRIPARSLRVYTKNDREAWKFSYKSPKDEITTIDDENPTGKRHQGFIHFLKEDMQTGDNAMDIDCSVDCSCPDYRYRLSYANKAAGAGENGPSSLNKGFNYQSSINVGPGLCKHLIALKEYLKTKVDSVSTATATPTTPTTLPATTSTTLPPSVSSTPTINTPVSTGTPVLVPKSPATGTTPTQEPDEEPDTKTNQAPDPDKEEDGITVEPNDNPTQSPQEPEEIPSEKPDEENPDDTETNINKKETDKKKLKENRFSKSRVFNALDELCKVKTFTIE
jgi:hypothetical protein